MWHIAARTLLSVVDERNRPTVAYDWSWSLHPTVLAGIGVLGVLYWYGIGPLRRRLALGPPASAVQIVSFHAAVAVLLLSLNGPIHDLSDYYLFSVHMVQHLVLTLVFPPLLIAGLPSWLLRYGLVRPAVSPVVRSLSRPWLTAMLFTASIAIWHLVPLYEVMMRNHEVHVATHLLFLGTATLLWWPVMSPLSELPRLSPTVGMLYLFLVGIPMQVVGAMITFADEVLYPWYAAAPRTWGLSPVDDQKLGGLLMWVPGNLWMFGAIGVLFFRWARSEERNT